MNLDNRRHKIKYSNIKLSKKEKQKANKVFNNLYKTAYGKLPRKDKKYLKILCGIY